jgi:hypothetical protein
MATGQPSARLWAKRTWWGRQGVGRTRGTAATQHTTNFRWALSRYLRAAPIGSTPLSMPPGSNATARPAPWETLSFGTRDCGACGPGMAPVNGVRFPVDDHQQEARCSIGMASVPRRGEAANHCARLAVRPCRNAMRRDCRLPSSVFGPVLIRALCRLASICLCELMFEFEIAHLRRWTSVHLYGA